MNPATSEGEPEVSPAKMRELTLRACEVARLAAEAADEGITTGAARALNSVVSCEEELDALDRQVNEGVTAAIPGASEAEARELLSCLKFILELERVGDLLLNFSNRARTVAGRIEAQDSADLKHMLGLLSKMLEDAQIAFRDRDLKRATAIMRVDAEMDRVRNLMFVRHIDNPEHHVCQESFHLVFMTQTLERAGDHAKNMAEEVCHLVTGRSVRHLLRAADKPFEEMFVDWMRRQTSRKE
jgi:phosphate transport system protein